MYNRVCLAGGSVQMLHGHGRGAAGLAARVL